ncbi:MAG: hypothetical protein K8H84_04505 [Sulfuricella denitrificans]|nr:hypothetical protein [Sulfuricella denitrificans]
MSSKVCNDFLDNGICYRIITSTFIKQLLSRAHAVTPENDKSKLRLARNSQKNGEKGDATLLLLGGKGDATLFLLILDNLFGSALGAKFPTIGLRPLFHRLGGTPQAIPSGSMAGQTGMPMWMGIR